ncbi:hypothetical protein C6W96_14125 [Streptomyces sp. CS149]|nr:hypothetical protein C6W96_14125 [Streptomyces sp. CS149]
MDECFRAQHEILRRRSPAPTIDAAEPDRAAGKRCGGAQYRGCVSLGTATAAALVIWLRT